ncbi:MAG: family 20 glycosylhydrolase, partial [Kiritimatiellae bacterium]|nr:family 20 glycosylhydrolase [Kiritimatiellia bacterium]
MERNNRWPWKIRAVQLDLARQMETVDFVLRYTDAIAQAGFNTLVLYLEGRIRTPGFPYRPAAESYTPAQMTKVVEHAATRGIEVVPAVSVLGHAEQFVTCPEMREYSEERDGRTRFGNPDAVHTFCLSQTATRAFLEGYLAEIAAIFPARHLHLGCDEAWNYGFCRVCEARRREIGFGGLFTEFITWAAGVSRRLGKRMWMWDDLYEFFPEELDRAPRDVVMCHWNYDGCIHPEGSQAHFRNRYRRDWLGDYARLGLDALVCPWSGESNVRSLTEYARRYPVLGGLATQWEMSNVFHGTSYPSIMGIGKLWNSPAYEPYAGHFQAGLKAALPEADEDQLDAVRLLTMAGGYGATSSASDYLEG